MSEEGINPVVYKFMEKVEAGMEEGSCWLWKGGTAGRYRGFSLDNVWIQAHRASWMLFEGEIPQGCYVLHKCDQPLCVNPDHLFLGSQKENLRDMGLKGRNADKRALTKEEAAEIRRLYMKERYTHRALAAKYRVGKSTITRILNGDSYVIDAIDTWTDKPAVFREGGS